MIELDKGYIDNVCEIANTANETICVGKLNQLPCPDNAFMLSIVSRSDNFPLLKCRTPLKVHIRNAKLGSLFLVGKVDVSKTNMLLLRDLEVLAKTEKRDAFRVRFEHNASFRAKRESRSAGMIHLRDISMGGFMCQSRIMLSEDKIYTVELPINGGIYPFDFQIVRILPSQEDGIYIYGCQFSGIGDKLQDILNRFVFSLQKECISKLQK